MPRAAPGVAVPLTPRPACKVRSGGAGSLKAGLGGACCVLAGFVLVLALAAVLVMVRLSTGPLTFSGLRERTAEAIASRMGPGWSVLLHDTALELHEGAVAIRTSGLDIRNPQGVLIVRAPDAFMTVDTLSLLTARMLPRSIEFRDLQLRALLNKDGSLSFVPPNEAPSPPGLAPAAEPQSAGPAPEPAGAGADVSPVSAAAASLFGLAFDATGISGVLDRAQVRNARLTVADAQGRERASFGRVDAVFDRVGASGRRFDMRLDGPSGTWSLRGEVAAGEGGRQEGALRGSDIPIADLLLLSGLSKLPATTDLKLSGWASASLAQGRLTRLSAQFETGQGTVLVNDKDVSPIPVQSASGSASWDEAGRVLSLADLAFTGGGSTVRLSGELALAGDQGWRLSLAGRDASLAGSAAGDGPVAIEAIEARLSGRDGAFVLEQAALRGPKVALAVTGSLTPSGDDTQMKVKVVADGADVRAALRLWPEPVAPPVRRYLVANLKDGRLDRLSAEVGLSFGEIARATRGVPVPDQAVAVAFAIRDGELFVAEGLPSVSRVQVSGTVSGTRAAIDAPGGRVALPDGRTLNLGEGRFVSDHYWGPAAIARIGFRMEGAADAFGAFLATPLMRSMAGLDSDPSTLKGRTDLRVSMPLPINNLPRVVDLPLTVTGSLADIAVDKAFGKERLEGGQLALAYENGALQIKGEGRIGGAPASIDVRQVKGVGEAAVTLMLDDAARARKGLSFGSQLTGLMPVKAVVPLGRPGKPPTRVEADLTRAAIDNVVPGWTKAAGRPGRLAFTLGENQTELRDLALDSGSVQFRGAVTLTPDGQLERADLSTFKISPGDDMRATLERNGGANRVTIRGGVADARPLIRSLSAAPTANKGLDQRDVELDLAVSILTGFNDEALTNATVKASTRGRDVRQLQMGGRFRSAALTAHTLRGERGVPVLALEAADAGATLRFFDIYRRMHGGKLLLQIMLADGPQMGAITVSDFMLRNEPALKSIVSTQVQAAMPEDRVPNAQAQRINPNEISFNRLKGSFTRSSGRLDFTDTVLSGAAVGFTLSGWIDYARDRTDVSGTFVPAYGLNNVFAQVPLFGPLLGGGQNEGLLGVNFRVVGALSAPAVTINPLSAVAPGFLRKLFGAGGGETGLPPAVSER